MFGHVKFRCGCSYELRRLLLGAHCVSSFYFPSPEVRPRFPVVCYHISRSRTTIGRGLTNDIRVEDERHERMISLQHLVIVKIGNSAFLVDTSLNGTYVNHRRVRRCLLQMNDVIRLGKTRRKNSRTNFVFIPSEKGSSSRLAITDLSPPRDNTNLSDLDSSIQCPKCSDYMVIPTAVAPCNDHFCNECLEQHFRASDVCPSCTSPARLLETKPNPKMTQIIDKILSHVLPRSSYNSFISRLSRRKSILIHRHNQLDQLMNKFNSVKSASEDPFLAIYQTWTHFEKTKFSKGITNYPIGDPRIYYCWIVGLTPEWVFHYANRTELGVAMENLGIPRPVSEISVEEMQQKLIRFIYSS